MLQIYSYDKSIVKNLFTQMKIECELVVVLLVWNTWVGMWSFPVLANKNGPCKSSLQAFYSEFYFINWFGFYYKFYIIKLFKVLSLLSYLKEEFVCDCHKNS